MISNAERGVQNAELRVASGRGAPPLLYSALPISHSAFRSGFTLVELLVVITILSIVTAAAIPIMSPAVETRRVREAARIVSAMFTGAQTRALASGRPAGVWIERLPAATGASNASMTLFLCEVPPPYGGDTTNATVQVQIKSATDAQSRAVDSNQDVIADGLGLPPFVYFKVTHDGDFTPELVRIGDSIQFNLQGHIYQVHGPDTTPNDGILDNGPSFTVKIQRRILDPRPNDDTPWDQAAVIGRQWSQWQLDTQPVADSQPVPYQILRQPQKSSEQPVQLPDGAVIDLTWSGFNGVFEYPFPAVPTTDPLVVTFAPSGAVEYIYISRSTLPLRPAGAIHFLVGKREKVVFPVLPYLPADTAEVQVEKHNWKDLENLWVSVQPQTGIVVVSNVAAVDDAIAPLPLPGNKGIFLSREFAGAAQGMGGR